METLHVLVVDDEESMRQGMARALRGFTVELPEFRVAVGLELSQAPSGEEALARIAAGPVDLMLLDHKMEGLQGLDVLHRITEEKREIVAIMVTAYASIETAVSATKQGAFDFLAKPFTPAELKATVEKAVRHLFVQRHARKLERERSQLRFQLISVVAHELKSPLAVIESFLQLLQDPAVQADAAQRAHFLERARYRLEGMRKLIADLLDLTRIESGQRRRELGPVDLVPLAAACVEGARAVAKERGIAVGFAAPAALPLQGDPGELEIILNNLLGNAVKYNLDGGRVDVTLEAGEDRAVIRVRDTGIGMTAEEAARLFQEFVRIKNARTRNILGSGLGLSIVRKLARLYGGDVAVASAPGEGSTFTVTLGRAAAAGGAGNPAGGP